MVWSEGSTLNAALFLFAQGIVLALTEHRGYMGVPMAGGKSVQDISLPDSIRQIDLVVHIMCACVNIGTFIDNLVLPSYCVKCPDKIDSVIALSHILHGTCDCYLLYRGPKLYLFIRIFFAYG